MINVKLVKFLLVICAAFCVVILLEWLYALYAQKQLLASINALDKQKNAVSELPTIELSERQETSYTDLVNRPLFIQGRKPVAETSTTTASTVTAASGTWNWELNGIYTQDNRLYALFSRNGVKTPKDNFRKITKDNNLDGWLLTEIHKDKVILTQSGNQKELLLRKSKPKDTHKVGDNPANMPGIPNPPPGMMPGMGHVHNPQEQIPVPPPMPDPIPEPVIEPELIPDDSAESNFENSNDEQY